MRAGLFRFEDRDRYSLVVHELRGLELHPIARAAHPSVPSRGRIWMLGEGHVGRAVRQNQLLVSGDIRQTSTWVRNPDTNEEDQQNYVSVLARPYYRADGKPGGAVTLTSSRVDHFTRSDEPAVRTFDTVVSFINMIMLEVQP